MKTIVCFGDSNTFGTNPDTEERWGDDVRWPRELQRLMGKDFYVVEEGLGGRETVFDDPFGVCRNGRRALPYVLKTHEPIDVLIISLGTNDAKRQFGATARMIAQGYEELITLVRSFPRSPKIRPPRMLLVAPIHLGPDLACCPFPSFDEASREKIIRLGPLLHALADRTGCAFLDASAVAGPGADQVHMDRESHLRLAAAMADTLGRIC